MLGLLNHLSLTSFGAVFMFYFVLLGCALVAVRRLSCIVKIILNLLTAEMIGLLVWHCRCFTLLRKGKLPTIFFVYLPSSVLISFNVLQAHKLRSRVCEFAILVTMKLRI